MTTGPRLRLGPALLPGLIAVALFVAMAWIVAVTPFGGTEEITGFPEGVSITAEIGYALFGFDSLQSTELGMAATEPFLISVLLIAVVLDAALDASLVLAKREEGGEPVTALAGTDAGAHTDRYDAGSGGAAADGGRSDVETDGGRPDGESTENGTVDTDAEVPNGGDRR